MLCFIFCYAEWHYSEWSYAKFHYYERQYAKWRYAECRMQGIVAPFKTHAVNTSRDIVGQK